MHRPVIIKKYGNRRLYDTDRSCHITLAELAGRIQSGVDVRVIDARNGEDLTQATLTQIVVECRGAARMLPVPLLEQLIRLSDSGLAEFLGGYLGVTLEFFVQARRSGGTRTSYNPFGAVPVAGAEMAPREMAPRMWPGGGFGASPVTHPETLWPGGGMPRPLSAEAASAATGPGQDVASKEDVAALRRELAELRSLVEAGHGTAKKAVRRPRKPGRGRST